MCYQVENPCCIFLLDMLNELHMRDYLLQEFFTFLVTCLFLVLVINCQSILLQHTFDFNFLMLSIRNSKKLNRGLFCNALMLFLCYNNYFDFVKEEGSHMKSKIEQLDGFEKRRMLLWWRHKFLVGFWRMTGALNFNISNFHHKAWLTPAWTPGVHIDICRGR